MIDALILCGGHGTRARPYLGDLPKVLAPVRGRPLLEHTLSWLYIAGIRRVVLSLGVGSAQVIAYLADPLRLDARLGMTVAPSIETEPLGTEGALRLAAPMLRSDPVLVLNGDTLYDADLGAFLAFQREGPKHPAVGVVTNQVSRWPLPSLFYSGLYLLPRATLLDPFPPPYTREFPIRGFIDIGTKEGWERANA